MGDKVPAGVVGDYNTKAVLIQEVEVLGRLQHKSGEDVRGGGPYQTL